MAQNRCVKGGVLKDTGECNDKEYLFVEYPFPEGDPRKKEGMPGLIKAYECWRDMGWKLRRIFYPNLPTVGLRRKFIENTGRSPEELGVPAPHLVP
jgi:hypothetical protein